MKHILNIMLLVNFFFAGCDSNEKLTDIIYPDGGYDYPHYTKNSDTTDYSYPLRHVRSLKDSFKQLYYGYHWGLSFNEPNLSLAPLGSDEFRLIFESAFGKPTVFILTQKEIVVKEQLEGNPYPIYDSTKLTTLEKYHHDLLEFNFPIQKKIESNFSSKKRFDSLTRLYPNLLDPTYYRYLLDKSGTLSNPPFRYSTKRISISKKQFSRIVNLINNSGYWQLPYSNECDKAALDGYGFILEANTAKKYNYVLKTGCPGDTSKFIIACQELINSANLDKKINLIWPDNP